MASGITGMAAVWSDPSFTVPMAGRGWGGGSDAYTDGSKEGKHRPDFMNFLRFTVLGRPSTQPSRGTEQERGMPGMERNGLYREGMRCVPWGWASWQRFPDQTRTYMQQPPSLVDSKLFRCTPHPRTLCASDPRGAPHYLAMYFFFLSFFF